MTINRLIELEHVLHVICRRCGHERTVDLQALASCGFGDRELPTLPWKCQAVVPDLDGRGSYPCGGRKVGLWSAPRERVVEAWTQRVAINFAQRVAEPQPRARLCFLDATAGSGSGSANGSCACPPSSPQATPGRDIVLNWNTT